MNSFFSKSSHEYPIGLRAGRHSRILTFVDMMPFLCNFSFVLIVTSTLTTVDDAVCHHQGKNFTGATGATMAMAALVWPYAIQKNDIPCSHCGVDALPPLVQLISQFSALLFSVNPV